MRVCAGAMALCETLRAFGIDIALAIEYYRSSVQNVTERPDQALDFAEVYSQNPQILFWAPAGGGRLGPSAALGEYMLLALIRYKGWVQSPPRSSPHAGRSARHPARRKGTQSAIRRRVLRGHSRFKDALSNLELNGPKGSMLKSIPPAQARWRCNRHGRDLRSSCCPGRRRVASRCFTSRCFMGAVE